MEELYKEGGLDRKFSILLGSAIISNTINFTAPSTTQYDKDMFSLAQKHFEYSKKYIDGLLQCRDSILNTKLRNILMYDMKCFEIDNKKCMIGQLELMEPKKLLNNKELNWEMQKLKTEKNADYLMFNIIDVKKNKSYLFCSDVESRKVIEKMFMRSFDGKKMEFDRILLRKTDLFPLLSKVLRNDINEEN